MKPFFFFFETELEQLILCASSISIAMVVAVFFSVSFSFYFFFLAVGHFSGGGHPRGHTTAQAIRLRRKVKTRGFHVFLGGSRSDHNRFVVCCHHWTPKPPHTKN